MGTNHAVTEPATWDATPPIVPDADADMDDATSIIEALAIKFGSRTKYLYAAIAAIPPLPSLTDYARKSVANVFSAANTFTAAIETRDINVRGGANIDVEGGVHADGTITSSSNISTPLDMVARDLNATRNVNAGDGAISGKSLNSDEATTVGTTLTVGGNITLPGDAAILLSGSDASKTLYKSIPLDVGRPEHASVLYANWRSESQTWLAVDNPVVITIPLPNLPNRCALTSLQWFIAGEANDSSVELVRRFVDWGVGVVGNVSTVVIGTAVTVPSYPDADYRRGNMFVASYVLHSESETLALRVTLGAGSALGRARLSFINVGPRSD